MSYSANAATVLAIAGSAALAALLGGFVALWRAPTTLLSIGVGAAIEPSVGVLIGIAVAIDNLSEGMSIGELVL